MHIKDSILGTFQLQQSLHHILQRARHLTALTVPEIETPLFSTPIPTTVPPESSETYLNSQCNITPHPPAVQVRPSPPSLHLSQSTTSLTVTTPDHTLTSDVLTKEPNISRANDAVVSSPTIPGTSIQTAYMSPFALQTPTY